MKKKVCLYLVITIVLLATIFLTGGMRQYKPMDETKMMPDSVVSEFGYDLIVKKEAKTGDSYCSELGLGWDREDIQSIFYTDVQEVCEKAFDDYLSPLQGLAYIIGGGNDIRYRTDKQTAVISPGRAEFYLFIQNHIAVVAIEDNGNAYDTSFRILREDETKGIEILAIPPLGGIGIAGANHEPEKKNYTTHELATEGELAYSKADIQCVFSADIQKMVKEIFGNYVQALQGLYTLAEQEGYGYGVSFWREDMSCDVLPKNSETTVIRDNYCEFTLVVNAKSRVRVSITRQGDQYITTFRLLKDGEFETQEYSG